MEILKYLEIKEIFYDNFLAIEQLYVSKMKGKLINRLLK